MSPELVGDGSKLERFSAGERFAVDPDAIERELSALWRAAGSSTGTRTPVTRACLWNVVVHLEERTRHEGHGAIEDLERTVRELPRYLAARALVLRTRDGAGEPLESWIAANCVVAPGGGKLVCSEEIAIAARAEGAAHLPGLVRALLVPQVPSAVVFAGVPPSGDAVFDALIGAADRLVVYADHCHHTRPLARVREVLPKLPLGVIDLGWLALAPVRSLVASLFDPPTPDDAASRISHVTITASPRLRASSLLLLGWIGQALGVGSARPIGQHAWRFARRGAGPAIEAVVVEDERSDVPSVELSAPSATWSLRPSSSTLCDLSGPELSLRKSHAGLGPTELLARALITRSEDRAFSRALALAGEL
ncbi:glucose-6-phosphate dehydrogenase assembly protein OpcA [Myxococcota bacterium]|nr:glucose-6-phosphate dehydrogenase assembly protein OpcA [Myxococcota bacterium]